MTKLAHNTTVDPEEIQKFSRIAEEWWHPDGKFKPLHELNPVRLKYIKHHICTHFKRNPHNEKPLKGLRILDIGCGGGLLCEPMARLGATIIGADCSEKNIKIAIAHAQQENLSIDYRATPIESLAETKEKYDILLNMEVIEHVAHPEIFINHCTNMIHKNGMMFFSTLNRTLKSFVFAIIGAEYILRWLPHGTHEWHKFITPDEFQNIIEQNGLHVKNMVGVNYTPLDNIWYQSDDLSVNYMGVALKPSTQDTL